MIEGIFVALITFFLASIAARFLKSNHPMADLQILYRLIPYHFLLSIGYYLYVQFNRSDSYAYYSRTFGMSRGSAWFDYYGTSTPFIEFIGFPFVQYLGLSYEGVMAVFSFFGLLGFFFFHIAFKENVRTPFRFFGIEFTTLILFLPNMHFWTGSFGKGSIIFLGIGLFFYSLKDPVRRFIPLILGVVITYHVRPHVMLVVLISSILGIVFSRRGTGVLVRVIFLGAAVTALAFIYQDVLTLVAINDEELFFGGVDLSKRATGLTNAGSGIDITNYNFLEKLFAFLYRPLFFDSPGILGVFVSVENLFYLVMTWIFIRRGGVKFLIQGDFMTKTAFLCFITVSVALSQVSGNLGLAVRQKSQVMMMFMFVIAKFLAERRSPISGTKVRPRGMRPKLAPLR